MSFGRHLAGAPRLSARVAALPGIRVAGAWEGFETAVRAILGQQVTVKGATTLAGRLVDALGEALPDALRAPGLARTFPSPEAVSRFDLRAMGVPAGRAGALQAMAGAVADGTLTLDPSADPDATRARLTAIPGIGPWTAEYIAMRALRDPDAFPAGDLGLRKAVSRGTPVEEENVADDGGGVAPVARLRRHAAVAGRDGTITWRTQCPGCTMTSTRPSARCAWWAMNDTSNASICRTRRLVNPMRDGESQRGGLPAALRAAKRQLAEYFDGTRRDFDLPLSADGTAFQRRVWDELRRIPYGETISYGELARRIGKPTASRAVGAANGRNPLAIVVPCHRVIGADGTLTGYGGGLPVKQALLALERRVAGTAPFPCH